MVWGPPCSSVQLYGTTLVHHIHAMAWRTRWCSDHPRLALRIASLPHPTHSTPGMVGGARVSHAQHKKQHSQKCQECEYVTKKSQPLVAMGVENIFFTNDTMCQDTKGETNQEEEEEDEEDAHSVSQTLVFRPTNCHQSQAFV